MRKYIFRILFFALIIMAVYKIDLFATVTIKEEDVHISKFSEKSNEESTLNCKVENKGTTSGGSKNFKITVSGNGGEKIYITDALKLDFYMDIEYGGLFSGTGVGRKEWKTNNNSVEFLLGKGADAEITKSEIIPENPMNKIINCRVHVYANKIILKKTGNVSFSFYTEVGIYLGFEYVLVDIEIQDVQKFANNPYDEMIKKHWRPAQRGGPTKEEMARNNIRDLKVVLDENELKKDISFSKSDYFKSFNYDKFWMGKAAAMKVNVPEPKFTSVCFPVKVKEDGTTERISDEEIDVNNVSEYSFEWDEMRLEHSQTYVLKYFFCYFEDLQKMLYVVMGENLVLQEGETEEEALERIDEELDQLGEEYMSDVIQEINIGISISMGEIGRERKNYGRLVDALADRDFYTKNLDSLKDDDAILVEEKTGKIVEVITSIGMVLAIIIPAILGVKYLIGSVEEKAEYKKGMIPYLVGATLLFSICTVVKIIQAIGTAINQI